MEISYLLILRFLSSSEKYKRNRITSLDKLLFGGLMKYFAYSTLMMMTKNGRKIETKHKQQKRWHRLIHLKNEMEFGKI